MEPNRRPNPPLQSRRSAPHGDGAQAEPRCGIAGLLPACRRRGTQSAPNPPLQSRRTAPRGDGDQAEPRCQTEGLMAACRRGGPRLVASRPPLQSRRAVPRGDGARRNHLVERRVCCMPAVEVAHGRRPMRLGCSERWHDSGAGVMRGPSGTARETKVFRRRFELRPWAAGCDAGTSCRACRCRRPGARWRSRYRPQGWFLRKRTTSPTWTSTNFGVLMGINQSISQSVSQRNRRDARQRPAVAAVLRAELMASRSRSASDRAAACQSAPRLAYRIERLAVHEKVTAIGVDGCRNGALGIARLRPTPGTRIGTPGATARTRAMSDGYVAPTTKPSVPCRSHCKARRATCRYSASDEPETGRS